MKKSETKKTNGSKLGKRAQSKKVESKKPETKPITPATKPPVVDTKKADIEKLLNELIAATSINDKKRIRMNLRKLGHQGGLNNKKK